jgi:hypothetical protein
MGRNATSSGTKQERNHNEWQDVVTEGGKQNEKTTTATIDYYYMLQGPYVATCTRYRIPGVACSISNP